MDFFKIGFCLFLFSGRFITPQAPERGLCLFYRGLVVRGGFFEGLDYGRILFLIEFWVLRIFFG